MLLVLVALGPGCFNSCAPLPPPNECAKADNGALDDLAIGPSGLVRDPPVPFRPWQDGDPVLLVHGGQGALMIIARLHATGAGGSCLGQETVVRDEAGREIAAERSPVLAEPSVDAHGVAIANTVDTEALLLPGDYPAPGNRVMVTASAGDRSVTRSLVIVSREDDLAAPSDLAPRDLAPDDDL